MSNEMPSWPAKFWGTPSSQFDDGRVLSIGEDVGDATASKQDMGAVGGLKGYGQISSANSVPPGGTGVGAGKTYFDDNAVFSATWGKGTGPGPSGVGILLEDSGVWVATVRVNFTPKGSAASNFNVGIRTILPDSSYRDVFTTHLVGDGQARIGHSSIVVAEEPGVVVRAFMACGPGRGTDDYPSTTLTVYRIDGGM